MGCKGLARPWHWWRSQRHLWHTSAQDKLTGGWPLLSLPPFPANWCGKPGCWWIGGGPVRLPIATPRPLYIPTMYAFRSHCLFPFGRPQDRRAVLSSFVEIESLEVSPPSSPGIESSLRNPFPVSGKFFYLLPTAPRRFRSLLLLLCHPDHTIAYKIYFVGLRLSLTPPPAKKMKGSLFLPLLSWTFESGVGGNSYLWNLALLRRVSLTPPILFPRREELFFSRFERSGKALSRKKGTGWPQRVWHLITFWALLPFSQLSSHIIQGSQKKKSLPSLLLYFPPSFGKSAPDGHTEGGWSDWGREGAGGKTFLHFHNFPQTVTVTPSGD